MGNTISDGIQGSQNLPVKPKVNVEVSSSAHPSIQRTSWRPNRREMLIGTGSAAAAFFASLLIPSCQKKAALADFSDRNNPHLRGQLMSQIHGAVQHDRAAFLHFYFPGSPDDAFYNPLIRSVMNDYKQRTGNDIPFDVKNMDQVWFDQNDFIDMRLPNNNKSTQRVAGNIYIISE